VDDATGEILHREYAVPQLFASIRHEPEGGFMLVSQRVLRELAADQTVTSLEMRLVFKLIAELHWDNYLYINVTDMAKTMSVTREATSRALSRLIKRGIIHRGERVGNAYVYRLDPSLGYKGKAPGRAALRADLARRRTNGDIAAVLDSNSKPTSSTVTDELAAAQAEIARLEAELAAASQAI
jgi:hypothetical protein